MKNRTLLLIFGSVACVSPSSAVAMDWPSKFYCTEVAYKICKADQPCGTEPLSKVSQTVLDLDLPAQTFDLAAIVEGQKVPNFSGKILHDGRRNRNEQYGEIILLFDSNQLLTIAPQQGAESRTEGDFSAVMQFAGDAVATTSWFHCTAKPTIH
jgi:hypothetical protein